MLILSESPESKNAALEDCKTEVRARRQKIEDVDLIIGHDVFYGLHTISKRPAEYITILRDPVVRYVSQYRYLVDCAQDSQSPIHEFACNKMTDGDRLLTIQESVDRQYWHNLVTNYLAAANHPDWSTKRWQIDDPREQLSLARDLISKMSFIGFVETLEQDTATLCAKLGLSYKLPVVNQSKSKVAPELPESTLAGIRELNALDQEIYDLAKTLMENIDAD